MTSPRPRTRAEPVARWLAGLVVLIAGCAGPAFVPGESGEADVVAAMGQPVMRMTTGGRHTVLWYPRFPFGRQSYAATFSPEGRLVAWKAGSPMPTSPS